MSWRWRHHDFELPGEFAVSLCAYLRQVELSVHRACSLEELRTFYRHKSIHPSVVLSTLQPYAEKLEDETASWLRVCARRGSWFLTAGDYLRAFWLWNLWCLVTFTRSEATVVVSGLREFEAVIDSRSPGDLELSALRNRLSTCAGILMNRIACKETRRSLGSVEHLNCSYYLPVIPIQHVPGWIWASGREAVT